MRRKCKSARRSKRRSKSSHRVLTRRSRGRSSITLPRRRTPHSIRRSAARKRSFGHNSNQRYRGLKDKLIDVREFSYYRRLTYSDIPDIPSIDEPKKEDTDIITYVTKQNKVQDGVYHVTIDGDKHVFFDKNKSKSFKLFDAINVVGIQPDNEFDPSQFEQEPVKNSRCKIHLPLKLISSPSVIEAYNKYKLLEQIQPEAINLKAFASAHALMMFSDDHIGFFIPDSDNGQASFEIGGSLDANDTFLSTLKTEFEEELGLTNTQWTGPKKSRNPQFELLQVKVKFTKKPNNDREGYWTKIPAEGVLGVTTKWTMRFTTNLYQNAIKETGYIFFMNHDKFTLLHDEAKHDKTIEFICKGTYLGETARSNTVRVMTLRYTITTRGTKKIIHGTIRDYDKVLRNFSCNIRLIENYQKALKPDERFTYESNEKRNGDLSETWSRINVN